MKIAVSACLMGEPCRYDGRGFLREEVAALGDDHEMVMLCPELLGGLEAPRPPCEIVEVEGASCVIDNQGNDLTQAFLDGSEKALAQAQEQGCGVAVLKAKSPSCGSGLIYDGTFSGTLCPGDGVTARQFRAAGIRVLDEDHLRWL